jgi:uncharacterized protein involved in high-affinity Fe2+ transport
MFSRGHGIPTARPPATAKHLIAEILDRETGEAVPYLPVEVELGVEGKTQQVRLQVMLGGIGLYYGADVFLPPGRVQVTLRVGPSTVHRTAAAPDRYRNPVQTTFEWAE